MIKEQSTMAKRNEVHNIDEMFDMSQFTKQVYKPEDFPNNVLILKTADKKLSPTGSYYLITAILEGSQEEVLISSGATQIVTFLNAWNETGSPAVRFSFYKSGRSDLMGKPKDNRSLPGFESEDTSET